MPSQCDCVSVNVCMCLYKCTFGLIQHTRTGPQHISPASVHRTRLLFSSEKNQYGLSAVDVKGHKTEASGGRCVCVELLLGEFRLFLFLNENDGIFIFHVTAKCLHNCVCLVSLISSAVILGFLFRVF